MPTIQPASPPVSPVVKAPEPLPPPAPIRAEATVDDPIAAPVRELLALFAVRLAEVQFPDVDHRSLALQTTAVEQSAREVREIETALADARRRLVEAQDVLHQRAHRATAYARIYADGDAALSAQLDAIVLPRLRTTRAAVVATAATEAPKKRGRPRRDDSVRADSLFATAAVIS